MIPTISRTLANVLAIETSLSRTEKIDFNPPTRFLKGKVALNIYCYDAESAPNSQSLSFVISAWDTPESREQPLLLEAMTSLQQHQQLEGEFLPPELTQCRSLFVEVKTIPEIEPVVLWESLGVPMRPALYVTVKVPAAVGKPALTQP